MWSKRITQKQGQFKIFDIETVIESIYLDFSISSIEESSELVNFFFQLRLVLPALLSAHLVGIVGDRVASLLHWR